MTADSFIYWLQGYFELSKADELTKEQVQEIKNHLKLCFNKATPEDPMKFFGPTSMDWLMKIDLKPNYKVNICSDKIDSEILKCVTQMGPQPSC